MKILVVTHYFPPEIGAPQARLSDLARFWAEAGEEVTVLTGMPNHPTGVIPAEYRGAIRREERVSGYRVIRTWLYATPNEGFVKKTAGHLSFMFTSVALGLRRAGRPDVVMVSSPTFFSIFSAWLISRLRRAPLVVEVRDLWPAIFVELGVLTNRRIIAVLEAVERWCYHQAAAVVVVSEGFRDDLVRREVPAEKVHVVRNGVDVDKFAPRPVDREGWRRRLGVAPDAFVVLYAGAHGISQGLAALADAAARLQDDPRVRFCFVGEGADKERVRAHVDQHRIANVNMLPSVTREEVPELLQAADVGLVPLRDVPLFSTFIPSKMFEMLAAGIPVVGSVTGEAAQLLGDAGAWVVRPEDSEAIAKAVAEVLAHPDEAAERADRGRKWVADHADRRQLATRYRELLASLVARPGP